jgi:hypothetical protein
MEEAMRMALMAALALGALGLSACVAEVPPDRGGYGYHGRAYEGSSYRDRRDVDRDRFERDRGERERCTRDPDDCRRF